MLYLILKIIAYLITATGLGLAAGYFARHAQAKKEEEALTTALNETKARLPQQDTLLRTRDEKLAQQAEQISEFKSEAKQAKQKIAGLERSLAQAETALKAAEARKAATVTNVLPGLDEAETTVSHDEDVVALKSEIASLQAEIQKLAGGDSADAIKRQLAQRELDFQSLAKVLDEREQTIAQLERERDLQQRSLQVLHQQLENERARLRA
ncbi:MAG: hypothetical protein NXH85_07715 [Pseudomonadaceae bacterium]|nr:hypothetical protein [Pseudomonadaceae bacterium]